jgi:hypothetical protein
MLEPSSQHQGAPMRTRHARRLVAVAIAALMVGLSLTAASSSTAETIRARKPAGATLSKAQLSQVLQDQTLPTTQVIPTTTTSHPFNGAAYQNVPIDLGGYGYVEKEYLLSGRSNVYDSTADGNFATTLLRSGDYTTRMLVRRPANMKTWSGKVNVEIINMSAGYDWTAIWSALWEQTLKDHDVYVGLTSKPNVLPGMQQFDAARYAALSWANPLPPEDQTCGTLPGEAGYDPNLSKLYENGLVWDMLTQTGRLLKSGSSMNPLGRPAKQVILTGESQSANFLLTYYRFFTPSAVLSSGRPVFDGYLAEAQVGIAGTPLNQCSTPLAITDNQRIFPDRRVPWVGINSQWDYPGARRWDTPTDSNTASSKHAFWELAGSNHGWEWQYLYGDANAADLIAAGFWDPATYDWSCGANNPEVPLHMSEKALFVQLKRWIESGRAPTQAPRILHSPITPGNGFDDKTTYDGLHNAMGGIRFPMMQVPVASFGVGQYALTGDCPEIVPFDDTTLDALYPNRTYYLEQYDDATAQLLKRGFILKPDAYKLRATARAVTSVG